MCRVICALVGRKQNNRSSSVMTHTFVISKSTSTTATRDIFWDILPIFDIKKGMIFHENSLPTEILMKYCGLIVIFTKFQNLKLWSAANYRRCFMYLKNCWRLKLTNTLQGLWVPAITIFASASLIPGTYFIGSAVSTVCRKRKQFVTILHERERSGSVIMCYSGPGAVASRLISSVTEFLFCPRARRINSSLVLIQLRKTRTYIIEDCWWDWKNIIKQKKHIA